MLLLQHSLLSFFLTFWFYTPVNIHTDLLLIPAYNHHKLIHRIIKCQSQKRLDTIWSQIFPSISCISFNTQKTIIFKKDKQLYGQILGNTGQTTSYSLTIGKLGTYYMQIYIWNLPGEYFIKGFTTSITGKVFSVGHFLIPHKNPMQYS